MPEGHLVIPTPLDKPIRLFDVDMTTTNNWVKEQIKRRNQNIIGDGLIDPDSIDGIISNSTNQGYIKCSAIPKGFFQDSNFAKSIAELEFFVPAGDNIYFIYALAKETDTIVTYIEDEFTPDHTYRDYTLDFLFSTTEDSSLGVRLGKIQQSGTSIAVLDTNRELSKIDFSMVGGSPDINNLDLLPAFNQSQFKKNASLEIEIKPEAAILTPIGSIQAWHKTFANKSTGTNDSTGASKLFDSSASFQTNGLQVDMIIHNQTDDTWSDVTAVDSETELTLADNIFTVAGKTYDVYATPKLPDSWIECNGQVISDSQSVYDGQTIQNLNGDGRFLRGSDISGTDEDFAMQGHAHQHHRLHDATQHGSGGYFGSHGAGGTISTLDSTDPIATSYGTPKIATETRPVNMSVVWIMRIK